MKNIIRAIQIIGIFLIFNAYHLYAFDYVLNKNFIFRPVQSKPAKNVDVVNETFYATYLLKRGSA